jgi:rhodanese-related sulfurtransferase
MAEWAQLDYEEKPDAVHLGRKPAKLECHAYKISPKLKEMAETLKQKNQVRVDMEPATSAFVDVTRVSLWSIDVPTSPNDMTGEFRDASVFKYLPDKSILLVIETPEAHSTAEAKLKEQGLFDSQ